MQTPGQSPPTPTVQTDFHVHTDASGTKRQLVAYQAPTVLHAGASLPPSFHIQVKELYAVLQALLRWGENWHNGHCSVPHYNSVVDRNQQCTICPVHHVYTAANYHDSRLPRHLFYFFLAALYAIADATSRYQYKLLFTLAPLLKPRLSSTDPWLAGIRHTIHSQLSVHSCSAWPHHPPPTKPTALASSSSLISSGSTPWPT